MPRQPATGFSGSSACQSSTFDINPHTIDYRSIVFICARLYIFALCQSELFLFAQLYTRFISLIVLLNVLQHCDYCDPDSPAHTALNRIPQSPHSQRKIRTQIDDNELYRLIHSYD